MTLEHQSINKGEQPGTVSRLADEALTFLLGTGLSDHSYWPDPAKAVPANATEKAQLDAAHQIINFTEKNADQLSTNGAFSLEKIKAMEQNPSTSAADKTILGVLDRDFAQLPAVQSFTLDAMSARSHRARNDVGGLLSVSKAYEQDEINKQNAWSKYLSWGAMGSVFRDSFPLGICTGIGSLAGPIGTGVGAAIGLGLDGVMEYEMWKTNHRDVPNYYDHQRQTAQSIVSDFLNDKRP